MYFKSINSWILLQTLLKVMIRSTHFIVVLRKHSSISINISNFVVNTGTVYFNLNQRKYSDKNTTEFAIK